VQSLEDHALGDTGRPIHLLSLSSWHSASPETRRTNLISRRPIPAGGGALLGGGRETHPPAFEIPLEAATNAGSIEIRRSLEPLLRTWIAVASSRRRRSPRYCFAISLE
jgi:hypothetical protein